MSRLRLRECSKQLQISLQMKKLNFRVSDGEMGTYLARALYMVFMEST